MVGPFLWPSQAVVGKLAKQWPTNNKENWHSKH